MENAPGTGVGQRPGFQPQDPSQLLCRRLFLRSERTLDYSLKAQPPSTTLQAWPGRFTDRVFLPYRRPRFRRTPTYDSMSSLSRSHTSISSEGGGLLFPGPRTYRDSGTAARRQRTLGPRNSGARSGPGNISPSSRPGRAQYPNSIRGAKPGVGTWRPGRGSAHARRARSSVATAPRPSSLRRHEELSSRAQLPAQPRSQYFRRPHT